MLSNHTQCVPMRIHHIGEMLKLNILFLRNEVCDWAHFGGQLGFMQGLIRLGPPCPNNNVYSAILGQISRFIVCNGQIVFGIGSVCSIGDADDQQFPWFS